MEQDERAVVRKAQDAVQQSLVEHGRVMPGAVMLVSKDPITEQPLQARRAVAMSESKPFADQDAFDLFVGGLRAEALRLSASAVAIIGEAGAEISDHETRRVALIRLEDATGIQLMHAPIDRKDGGAVRAGDFMATPEAPDILQHPVLPTTE